MRSPEQKLLNKKRLKAWSPLNTVRENIKVFEAKDLAFNRDEEYWHFAKHNKLKYKRVSIHINKNKFLKVYSPELSIVEMAEKLKRTPESVYVYLKRNNLKFARHKERRIINQRKRYLKYEVINYLLRRNFTFEDIARLFQCTRQQIHNIINKVQQDEK